MDLRELTQRLQDGVIRKLDQPVQVLDADGFIHEIQDVVWDDEKKQFYIRTRFQEPTQATCRVPRHSEEPE